MVLDYDLQNLSDKPTNWLWSAHPLLQVDAGDLVVLPDEVDQVTVEYTASDLFKSNYPITWPNALSTSGVITDLSKVGKKDGATAYKLFARMSKDGWGALYRQRMEQGLVVRFDPAAMPYLGIWVCLGAWPETGEKQYTVALEPTTSSSDSLVAAQQNGTACRLDARAHCRWRLELELLGASRSIDLEDFRAMAALPRRL